MWLANILVILLGDHSPSIGAWLGERSNADMDAPYPRGKTFYIFFLFCSTVFGQIVIYLNNRLETLWL